MTNVPRTGLAWLLAGFVVVPAAHAQIATPCLKPVAIADKWEEAETPPWDSSDTYSTLDTYGNGFIQPDDQGRPIALRLGAASGSAVPLSLDPNMSGAQAFVNGITSCPGTTPHSIGSTLPIESGDLVGPMIDAFQQVIDSDPTAVWDPAAGDGKGAVVGSAFTVSPRMVALPVYDPAAFAASQPATLVGVTKIVGFFVSHTTSAGGASAVHGYLTGVLDISMPPLSGASGDRVTTYAILQGPGTPLKDIPVEFSIDGAIVGTVLTSETGIALLEDVVIPNLPAGTYPDAVTARVGANAGFFISNVHTAGLTVIGVRPTATSLVSSPNPSLFGGSVIVQVSVSGQDQVPGGSVELFDGDASLGTATMTAGSAMFGPLTMATGPHVLRAIYVGDAFNGASSSPPVTHVVQRAASSLAFSRTPLQSLFGQAVTLSARVASIAGVPTGEVTFSDGGVLLGSAALLPAGGDGAVATVVITSLSAGSHGLSATYQGSADFLGISSSPVTHVVAQAATATQLSSSPNPSKTGEAVSLRAVVAAVAPGGGIPAGSVEFLNGTTVIGTASVVNGVATVSIVSLKAGKHQLRARYLGTSNHAASVSTTVTHNVKGK
jgi:Bacterial Ig-like domain (group 3)